MRNKICTTTLLAVAMILPAGCWRSAPETDSKAVTTVYETTSTKLRVVYEDRRSFDMVVEGLYWHNQGKESSISVSDEDFLRQVVPILNRETEQDPHLLYISADEATTFYRNSFRAQSIRQEKSLPNQSGVRFRVESIAQNE